MDIVSVRLRTLAHDSNTKYFRPRTAGIEQTTQLWMIDFKVDIYLLWFQKKYYLKSIRSHKWAVNVDI